jgi:phosphatidylglycerol---prolipoprotein diacylglyceryl transferase
MIPYVTLPPISIGSLVLQPFALLVSAGVLISHFTLLSRARRHNLNRGWAAEMSVAMVACGFAGAVLFKFLYRPESWAAGIWPGISSFGGLFGALAGGALYLVWARRIRGPERLRYFDSVAFAFPFGFTFGRLGCALTHDHPGLRAADRAWLAVAYPDGARYDLGLLEMLFLMAVCGVFLGLERRPRPAGFFVAAMLLAYGLFRIALDRLHVDPPRYGGVTVDQWAGAAAAGIGLYLFSRSKYRVGDDPIQRAS